MTFEGKKGADKWFPVRLVNSVDSKTPVPGKVFSDIAVRYGYEAATSESVYAISTNEWKEQGDGNYWLLIGTSEFGSEGKYIVKVECSGCDDVNFCVEVRDKTIAELIDDAGTLLTRLTAARAGYLDNLASAAALKALLAAVDMTDQTDITMLLGQIRMNHAHGGGTEIRTDPATPNVNTFRNEANDADLSVKTRTGTGDNIRKVTRSAP